MHGQKDPVIKAQIFRFSTARMKMNQILCVIFQAKSQFYFKFWTNLQCHDTVPLKFSNWKIICFGQKEPISVQPFWFLSALVKVHPISHSIFEITRLGFIKIFHHCSASWKITPLYFLALTSYTLDKNSPLKWHFLTFEWLSENLPNSLCHIWNYMSVFL